MSLLRRGPAVLMLLVLAVPAARAAEHLQLFVREPYLELHTGPGRGYPVFNVVPREGSVDVLERYTDWFKVRTERGIEGWASARDLTRTVRADGTAFSYDAGDRNGFTAHSMEFGVFFYDDYGGASALSVYGSYSFIPSLAAELSVGEFLGTSSDGTTVDLGLTHVFYPQGWASPFVSLGTGMVQVEPKATLVVPANRTEQTAYVGGGVRVYLTRRFFLRGEYRAHMVFTRLNENQQVDEWKFGFAFFF
jgi:hypothetical protein